MSKKTETKIKTHVAIIVDKSGSMSGSRDQVISNFNEQIQDLKQKEKDGHDVRCTIISFNSSVQENVFNAEVGGVSEISTADYAPSGGTALYDAMEYTLTKLRALAAEDTESAFLVVVMSDGDSNSDRPGTSETPGSQEVTRTLISACNEDKRWTISYIGCDLTNAQRVAQSVGLNMSNVAAANMNSLHYTKSFAGNLRKSTDNYFSGRERGLTSMVAYASGGDVLDSSSELGVMTEGLIGASNWSSSGNVEVDTATEAILNAAKASKDKPLSPQSKA